MDLSVDSEVIRDQSQDYEDSSASKLESDLLNLHISKTSTTPTSKPHHGRKSFSGLGDAVEELRSLPRPSILAPRTARAVEETEVKDGDSRLKMRDRANVKPFSHSKASEWLRRAASMHFRHRRHSTSAPLASHSQRPETSYNTASVHRAVAKPPKWDPSDYSHTSGAAARAAAAAQNEFSSSARTLATRGDTRLTELKVTRDSESGIGIDLRDRAEETAEAAVPVVRKGQGIGNPSLQS